MSIADYSITGLTANERAIIKASRSQKEELSNIDSEVLTKISSIAKLTGVPIILRSVNEDALPWLKAKDAVGKNMAVHGKSSEHDMLAGLIPVRSSISKAANGDNAEEIAKANKENENAVAKSESLIQDYKLATPETKATLFSDLNALAILAVALKTTDGKDIYIFEDPSSGKSLKLLGKPVFTVIEDNGTYSRIDENHQKLDIAYKPPGAYSPVQVKVFAKPSFNVETGDVIATKPITADIDVLAYGSKIDNLGHDTYRGQKTSHEAGTHDMIGQGPKVIRGMIENVVRPALGRDLISHGPEQYNLDYVQKLTPPWIHVAPSGEVKVLSSEQDLVGAFNQYKQQTTLTGEGLSSVSFEPNPHWGWELQPNHKSTGYRFIINTELKKLFERADQALAEISDTAQQLALKSLKLEVGLAYINKEKNRQDLDALSKTLETTLDDLSKDQGVFSPIASAPASPRLSQAFPSRSPSPKTPQTLITTDTLPTGAHVKARNGGISWTIGEQPLSEEDLKRIGEVFQPNNVASSHTGQPNKPTKLSLQPSPSTQEQENRSPSPFTFG